MDDNFKDTKPMCRDDVSKLANGSSRNDAKGGGFFSPFTFYHSPLPAFTLSEVIITLGIIGVLAAMTIPVLMKNYQNAQFAQAFLKEYSVINQAWAQVIQDNDGYIGGSTDVADTHSVIDALSRKLSIIAVPASAMPYDITSLSGVKNFAGHVYSFDHGYMFLRDGAIIQIAAHDSSANCDKFMNTGSPDIHAYAFKVGEGGCYKITIDTNGMKLPNTLGRDIFPIWLTNKGVSFVSYMAYPSDYSFGSSSRCSTTDAVGGTSQDADLCAYRLVIEGKMNY